MVLKPVLVLMIMRLPLLIRDVSFDIPNSFVPVKLAIRQFLDAYLTHNTSFFHKVITSCYDIIILKNRYIVKLNYVKNSATSGTSMWYN